MNSRERVRLALNHKEMDRIPFDLGGTVLTSMHHAAYLWGSKSQAVGELR